MSTRVLGSLPEQLKSGLTQNTRISQFLPFIPGLVARHATASNYSSPSTQSSEPYCHHQMSTPQLIANTRTSCVPKNFEVSGNPPAL